MRRIPKIELLLILFAASCSNNEDYIKYSNAEITNTSTTEVTENSPIETESVTPIMKLSPTSIVAIDPKDEEARDLEAIDYEIYSKIILEQTSNRIRGQTVLINDTTVALYDGWSEEILEQIFTEMEHDTLQNYIGINKLSYRLEELFTIDRPYILLSIENDYEIEIEKMTDTMGAYKFSRVGYNTQQTQAFLYMGIYCGLTCGVGKYYFLENDGNWKINKEEMIWVG